jgi:hypothetical protein
MLDAGCSILDDKPTMFFSLASIEHPVSSAVPRLRRGFISK